MTQRRRLTPDELLESKERANRKRFFRRRWASDATLAELCSEMGQTEAELVAYAAALGLGERPEPECYLPTREEIRLACAAFRAGWSESERESRLSGGRYGRLEDATGHDTQCQSPKSG